METLCTVMSIISAVMSVVVIILIQSIKSDNKAKSERSKDDEKNMLSGIQSELRAITNRMSAQTEKLSGMTALLQQQNHNLDARLENLERRLSSFTAESEIRLENIRKSVDSNLSKIREDNNTKLDEMRRTVDEKLRTELDRRLKESFSSVSELLGRLQTDIGSMKSLAEDVGGLKKTLSGVKTRGMLGEYQLESILSDIFSSDQYEKNAKPRSDESYVVEFALKIPTEDGDSILLPIDSKFPQDTYAKVIEAVETCDREQIKKATDSFIRTLELCANDIKTKYVAPPYTTDYAIMFLPTESMYAEAINNDMHVRLWQKYRVYIASPSTIAALLSSIQMAFSNIAIQKHAGEVFSILDEVKSEFNKFGEILVHMQKNLNTASDDLNKLMGVRTRKINQQLNRVSSLRIGDSNAEAITDGTFLPDTSDEQ